jgi:NAD(P)H-flavin reductase
VKLLGHNAEIRTIDEEHTEVLINDISFSWVAGQHIYLRLPSFGFIEAHPFTIANAYESASKTASRRIQLIVESKSGFTRRLHRAAAKGAQGHKITAIVTGPLGRPPRWASYETLVLIAASTGITFTLPILESVVANKGPSCVTRIDFLLVVRKRAQTDFFLPRFAAAIKAAEAAGIALKIRIAVTCETCGCCGPSCACVDGETDVTVHAQRGSKSYSETSDDDCIEKVPAAGSVNSRSGSITSSIEKGETSERIVERISSNDSGETGSLMRRKGVAFTSGRPNLEDFIRRPVEASGGETSVTVCGGMSLVACIRNHVASLSNERAVHKGTGAQGIHLHTEHYCF